MAGVTVRVSSPTHARLARLARETGMTMTAVLDAAIESYEDSAFWERLYDAVLETRSDPEQCALIEAERRGESGALGDRSPD